MEGLRQSPNATGVGLKFPREARIERLQRFLPKHEPTA
jgi:hypothetical protein